MPGSKTKLSFKQKEGGVEINIPADLKNASSHVWVIKVKN